MPMFISPDERVPISDERGNTIYIRAAMDVGTRNRVTGAMFRMGGDGKAVEMDLGANLTALLEHNILAWEGPDFAGVACTAENIRKLNPNEPLVEQVSDEIARRNKASEIKDPKESTSAGAPSSKGERGRVRLVNGTRTSS